MCGDQHKDAVFNRLRQLVDCNRIPPVALNGAADRLRKLLAGIRRNFIFVEGAVILNVVPRLKDINRRAARGSALGKALPCDRALRRLLAPIRQHPPHLRVIPVGDAVQVLPKEHVVRPVVGARPRRIARRLLHQLRNLSRQRRIVRHRRHLARGALLPQPRILKIFDLRPNVRPLRSYDARRQQRHQQRRQQHDADQPLDSFFHIFSSFPRFFKKGGRSISDALPCRDLMNYLISGQGYLPPR